jgi:hypothetical protein
MDVRDGIVSVEAARRIIGGGVALGIVDDEATRPLREAVERK